MDQDQLRMEIGQDMFAVIEYTVQLEDGSCIKGEDGPVSMNFVVGYNQLMPSLEKRLIGLQEGTEKEFVIPARDAFGDYDPSQVHTRSLGEFPEGRHLEVGKWAIATNPETEAQYSYFVREKTPDTVTLDFNHPLAGKDLHYRVRVVRVRPADEEELLYLRPCEQGQESDAVQ
jgi:FKBP-type peptidyl-prolyl cis-trans isomerase SlyD